MVNTPSNKQLSRDLSNRLDELGFGKIERWERIHHWNIQTKIKNLSMKLCINTKNERISVGSQQEGIGLSGLSDIDVLQVEHDVLCIDHTRIDPHDNRLVLNLAESNAPPGYCFLELSNSAITSVALEKHKYALVNRNNQLYIGSKLFLMKHNDDNVKLSDYMKTNTRYHPQTGPSLPKSVSKPLCSLSISWYGLNPNDKIDFVRALPCHGYLALKSWQQRPRPNNWPSKKMVRHIMTLPIYVVPVGLPGSLNEDIQWRISFVRAETYLVQTLNTVQAKILVLLKLVGKHYLGDGCPCITSYIVKNVMFWLAESMPQKKFRQKHIMARLKDALEMLKVAVKMKTLPSYIQPEKNLFAYKLNAAQQEQVLDKIDYLLQNDKMLVNACLHDAFSVNTVCNAIIQNIVMFNKFTKRAICILAMYPVQSQILFYLTPYKVNGEEKHILQSHWTLPKFIWKYGIKGWYDARTVNLYKYLADLDRVENDKIMENVMKYTSDIIRKPVSISSLSSSFCMRFRRIALLLYGKETLQLGVIFFLMLQHWMCTWLLFVLHAFIIYTDCMFRESINYTTMYQTSGMPQEHRFSHWISDTSRDICAGIIRRTRSLLYPLCLKNKRLSGFTRWAITLFCLSFVIIRSCLF